MIISGFTTFAPKFVEAQFNISAGLAAQLIGQSNLHHDAYFLSALIKFTSIIKNCKKLYVEL